MTMDTRITGTTHRDWLSFTRSDYIAAKVVLGIAVAGSVMFGLAGPALDAVSNAPLPMTYTTSVTSGIELPRGARFDGNATTRLLLTDATPIERLTQALPAVLTAGLTIAVAWLLFQLIRSTQAGDPFTRRNVWRINGIALIVGLGGMLAQLAGGVADNALQTTGRLPRPNTLTFEMTVTPVPLVLMLMIALVAEAFRRGVVLRDDVDGLV
jgi:hypothetical protein